MLKTSDFDYELPENLIAQTPLDKRDQCRLLHLNKSDGGITHSHFNELCSYLNPGDRLVFNDTRVVPARVFCSRKSGGYVELLFIKKISEKSWESMVKPSSKIKPDERIVLVNDSNIELIVKGFSGNGTRIVELPDSSPFDVDSFFEQYGHMPLPPYITRQDTSNDRDKYQTVYAKNPGAIAAPTAGLHFTKEIFQELENNGIEKSFVTLHVGIGTFRPVKVDNPLEHDIHSEWYSLSDTVAKEICTTLNQNKRVIAVGTTVVRTLEHCAENILKGKGSEGFTKLMILPPFNFRIINGIITNFHLPKSTLLMLISAFASSQYVLHAYKEAVKEKYRFFSYGDAMIIL